MAPAGAWAYRGMGLKGPSRCRIRSIGGDEAEGRGWIEIGRRRAEATAPGEPGSAGAGPRARRHLRLTIRRRIARGPTVPARIPRPREPIPANRPPGCRRGAGTGAGTRPGGPQDTGGFSVPASVAKTSGQEAASAVVGL